jgi:hypothetical protein
VIDEVAEVASRRRDPKGIAMKNLERYSKNGLWKYDRGRGSPVKPEWGGVYRIAPTRSLFRIYGFYEGGSLSDFIAIDAFTRACCAL